MKIKIIGSGSAGNHIAYAFSKMPVKIIQTDLNLAALKDQNLKYIKKDIKNGQRIFPKN